MEGRELDGVAVYFADVEVGADVGNVSGRNVVCGAPDAFGGFMLMGCWLGRWEEVGVDEDSRDRLMFPSGLCR
jgi:hypothetical protein